MGDSWDLLLPGGLQQLGLPSVRVSWWCVLLFSGFTDHSTGNTQAATNYILSVSVLSTT